MLTLTCPVEKDAPTALRVAGEIGKMVAKMHDAQVCRGVGCALLP